MSNNSITNGINILNKWNNELFLSIDNEHLVLKLENLHNFIYNNYYNRKELKNSKRLINFIYDLFFEIYGRNNLINEVILVKSFDSFISKHKHVFYSYNEEMIILYLNIFIETF